VSADEGAFDTKGMTRERKEESMGHTEDKFLL
jgi:hypothetical protein